MTFAFHHYSGMVLSIVLAKLLGQDPYLWGAFGFIVGGFPDSASFVMWKLSQQSWWKWKKWSRWELYGLCHPPYDATSGHGSWDRIYKWVPMWGQHTWLWDSIVHPNSARFVFPKFNPEWANEVWIDIWPAHKNIKLTKWDVLYGVLEVSLWGLYTLLFLWLI